MKKRILTALVVLVVLVGAVFAVNAESTDTLRANVTDGKTISTNTVLDLAGFDIDTLTVTDGAVVTIKDSATDDYKAATEADYGQIGNIVIESGSVKAADGYLQINEEGKGTSFHKYVLQVVNPVLRGADYIAENGAAVYYVTSLAGDEVIKANMESFGVAMKAGGGDYFAVGKNGGKTYTEYPADQWVAGKETQWNSCELRGIMKAANTHSTNKRNFEIDISCAAYIRIKGVEDPICGADYTFDLYTAVKALDDAWVNAKVENPDSIGLDAKKALVTMQNTFGVFTEYAALGKLNQLFGDGTFVIRSASDLQIATANPAGKFNLAVFYPSVTDLDMTGVEWTPFKNFTGTFTSTSGCTISNLTINGTGFFDTVATGATVSGLHLRDVNVVVPSDSKATAVGMIAGTNKGSVTGVTVTGTLKDTRKDANGANIYAGAIVGNNSGTVTAGTANTVSVSTLMEKSLAEDGKTVIEAERQTVTTNGVVTVTEAGISHTTTGLVADVGLFMNENSEKVTRGLVGTGTAATNANSVYWSDRSYSTERQSAELQRRRLVVEDDVFVQGTMKWTPATKIRYFGDQADGGAIIPDTSHIHNQEFNPGTTYIGVPYTHCASPVEQALYYMKKNTDGSLYTNSNGAYVLTEEVTKIKGGSTKKLSLYGGTTYEMTEGDSDWGGCSQTSYSYYDPARIGWGAYFGSDCSGGLTTAWHKVSPILLSSKANGGVCLWYTTNMLPSKYNQFYYGIKQVGDYDIEDATWTGAEESKWGGYVEKSRTKDAEGNTIIEYWVDEKGNKYRDYVVDTDDIYKNITNKGANLQPMYEVYAQSQMGDMVVAYSRTGKVGHARLIAEDPVVVRKGDGTIDGEKSYFLFHEQGAGLYVTPGLCSWRINWKCSFAEAALQTGNTMGGNGNGYYIPISMDAFHDDTTVSASGGLASGGNVITGNDPLEWKLNSSYRIMSAHLIIKDAQGNEVYNEIRFQGATVNTLKPDKNYAQRYRRAFPGYIPVYTGNLFADCCDNLTVGQNYTATFSGTTYGGVTNTKMNNYPFTYTPSSAS